jgi:hypothetical protein
VFECAFETVDVAGNLRRANIILVTYLVDTNRRTYASSLTSHAFHSINTCSSICGTVGVARVRVGVEEVHEFMSIHVCR